MTPTITLENLMDCLQQNSFCDIGQIGQDAKRELNKMVKKGLVGKWKACWMTADPLGTHKQKTWYGLVGSEIKVLDVLKHARGEIDCWKVVGIVA